MEISVAVKKEALALARWSLEWQICGNQTPKPDLTGRVFKEKRGSFVTLRHQGELRGCVGRVEPISTLGDEIVDLALSAAVRDPRFPPVSSGEVEELTIEISILTPPEIVKNILDIQIGEHGLIIERNHNRGLLLPQVAVEEGWGIERFLEHSCLKADLPSNAWKDPKTVIYRFSATVFSE